MQTDGWSTRLHYYLLLKSNEFVSVFANDRLPTCNHHVYFANARLPNGCPGVVFPNVLRASHSGRRSKTSRQTPIYAHGWVAADGNTLLHAADRAPHRPGRRKPMRKLIRVPKNTANIFSYCITLGAGV